MVEDEFELSVANEPKQKVTLKPFDLKGKEVSSLLQDALF